MAFCDNVPQPRSYGCHFAQRPFAPAPPPDYEDPEQLEGAGRTAAWAGIDPGSLPRPGVGTPSVTRGQDAPDRAELYDMYSEHIEVRRFSSTIDPPEPSSDVTVEYKKR